MLTAATGKARAVIRRAGTPNARAASPALKATVSSGAAHTHNSASPTKAVTKDARMPKRMAPETRLRLFAP